MKIASYSEWIFSQNNWISVLITKYWNSGVKLEYNHSRYNLILFRFIRLCSVHMFVKLIIMQRNFYLHSFEVFGWPMSNRVSITSFGNNFFFCHTYSTRMIFACIKKDYKWEKVYKEKIYNILNIYISYLLYVFLNTWISVEMLLWYFLQNEVQIHLYQNPTIFLTS